LHLSDQVCWSTIQKNSGTNETISSKKLSSMRPIEVIQMLKDNCCNGVMFEPTDVQFWSISDIQDLETFLGDNTPSAPVVSSFSSVSCQGERYVSTIDREARHLIKAIKAGRYPLSLCSTYDLKL
jgi:hypothetical protein